jgi:hypothetical protein
MAATRRQIEYAVFLLNHVVVTLKIKFGVWPLTGNTSTSTPVLAYNQKRDYQLHRNRKPYEIVH